ncbi:MAG TPA: hypothetical protein DCQ93_10035, partial [Bacteroidetes bacterium]|nr:hypothetical protein [Bacteroidota bacterium]
FINSYSQKNCFAPNNLMVTGTGSTSIKVRWEKTEHAIGYELRARITGTNAWSTMKVMAPDTTARIRNLQPNTDYEIQISALCNFELTDTSAYSPSIKFHTNFECDKPNGIHIDSITSVSSVIHWHGPLDAQGFVIRLKAANDKHSKGVGIKVNSASSTSYKLKNLKSGTKYLVTMRCICFGTKDGSTWTDTVSFTTPEK